MLKNNIHYTQPGSKKLLPLALMIGVLLITTACGLSSVVPALTTAGNNNPTTNPNANAAPGTTPAAGATTPAQANNPSSNANCDALFLANFDMGKALAAMVNLTPSTDYTAYTTPGSPFYLDFKKLRSDLDTLATLPDPSDAEALIVGKPSEAVTYFRQLMDLAETDIQNPGKPFVDTSPSGQKLIGIDTPWEKHAAVFGVAMANVCKNYQVPAGLFAGTPAAGSAAPTDLVNDSLMATAAAAGASMEATLNALATAMPEPTDTPAP